MVKSYIMGFLSIKQALAFKAIQMSDNTVHMKAMFGVLLKNYAICNREALEIS